MDATQYASLKQAACRHAHQLRRDAVDAALDALGRAMLRLLPRLPARKEKACPSST